METRNRMVWIGGGPAAGKTTISNILSDKYGYETYHCDREATARVFHAESGSVAHMFRQILESDDACRTFYDKSADDIISAYSAWAREDFETLFAEVVQASCGAPVIIEGAQQLAPTLLKGKVDPMDCVFLFCTPAFQERVMRERTWYLKYTSKASNPELAARNFISVTMKGAERAKAECRREGFRAVVTGGRIGIEEACKEVESLLGLAIQV